MAYSLGNCLLGETRGAERWGVFLKLTLARDSQDGVKLSRLEYLPIAALVQERDGRRLITAIPAPLEGAGAYPELNKAHGELMRLAAEYVRARMSPFEGITEMELPE